MLSFTSTSRALVAHTVSTPVLRCVVSGLVATAACLPAPLTAQATDQTNVSSESPNYRLAGRFAPYKIRDLIHSTSVQPNWIENSERFWYSWETNDGDSYYLVDPQAGTKVEIFDNDRIAAELTRITLDPWDGKHLPIRSIRFVDENTLQFEVESSQDEEEADEDEEQEQEQEEEDDEEGDRRDRADKKVFHFEYDVATRTLRELQNFESPDNHPTRRSSTSSTT